MVNATSGETKEFRSLASIFALAQSWDYKTKKGIDLLDGEGWINFNGKRVIRTSGSINWDPDFGEYYSLLVEDLELEGYQKRFSWRFGSISDCMHERDCHRMAELIIWQLFQERSAVVEY